MSSAQWFRTFVFLCLVCATVLLGPGSPSAVSATEANSAPENHEMTTEGVIDGDGFEVRGVITRPGGSGPAEAAQDIDPEAIRRAVEQAKAERDARRNARDDSVSSGASTSVHHLCAELVTDDDGELGAVFVECPANIDELIAQAREANQGPEVTLTDIQHMRVAYPEIRTDRGGFGLVEGHTNFYASHAHPQRELRAMHGHEVTLEAWPFRWHWDFGDGSPQLQTDVPGQPATGFNEATPTAHRFGTTGTFQVTLRTDYRARYRVGEEPWQDIPGVMTLESDPVTADIWRSRTRIVATDTHASLRGQ